jgi:hypothetical protein
MEEANEHCEADVDGLVIQSFASLPLLSQTPS